MLKVSTKDMTAVLTGVARLPCDLQPASDEDKVTLVIWYKDGASSPIYSLDVRGRSLDKATHWADERALGGRAFFQLEESWHLAVENVRESDGGSYRCRVDFKSSPTRNSIVNLSIIVPPRKLVILDENGTNIAQHGRVLGPYVEGTSVQVSCVAYGGRPSPRVSWWLGLDLVDDSDETLSERRVRNVLRLERLERRHLGTILTCTATNNDALPPLNVNVTIDLYLRPLEVRLLGENMPLSASSEYEVACQSTGSRPPAVISWWKAGLMLDHTRETTSADGNVTTSTLTLAPQVDDSGKSLICRAENRHVADSALEDSWNLNVYYTPIVKLELGSNLNGSSIREGVDVYLECNVQANPWVYKVIWRHNGQPLQNNVSTGIILSNQTLVLQSVNRNISGLYTCVASNSEGDSESNPFNLDVKYEPVCSAGQQKVYGAGRHEEVRIICDVDANPPAGLFRWSFNNSAIQAGLEIGSVSTEPGGGRSIATYIPTSERDYGTLLCWGRNDLGSQALPCVFHVVPAGKPDSPRNCALLNRTANLVQVVCVKGFDGGLPQEFTMELYSADHRRLISNVTSRSKPEFTVTGLEAGAGYFVSIYSSNGKGRSAAFTLPVSTLKSTHQEPRRTTLATTFPENLPQTVTPVLWVLAGIVVTLGFVGLVAVVVLRIRGCGMDQDSDDGQGTSTASPDSLANEPKSAVGAATIAEAGTGGGASLITVSLQGLKGPVLVTASSTTEEGVEMDDRNPDVIPHTTEVEYPIAVQEYKSYDNLGLDPGGRPMESVGVAQPTKSISYGNIPHYSRTNTSEAFRFEPQRWQQGMPWPGVIPPQLQPVQKVTAATQTQSAETQTPVMVRHKESAV